jgi:sugar phosphate isomerase/epimerase
MAAWVADLGYVGVQMPTGGADSFFDLALAAESQTYCDDIAGMLAGHGLRITELSTHLQGQLVAVHPAYDELFDGFAPPELRGKPRERQAWAVGQVKAAAVASRRLGLNAHATFSGALAWPYFYPWPQRPAGLIEEAFAELGRRWKPILDAFEDEGVDVCYEIHPGEDLHDGATFERFLDEVGGHARANILYDPSHFVLQQLDYLGYIDRYHERIRAFHVKDAEFRPSAQSGVYGGYQGWARAAGPLPLAGRRPGGLQGDLLQAGPVRLSRLGGAGMGVRPEAPRAGRSRRRAVHPRPHHPGDGQGVRRLRRQRARRWIAIGAYWASRGDAKTDGVH